MIQKITALVPMKDHSSRIPNKNMKILNGYPLCRYVLLTLSECDFIDRIVINTDSSSIADYVKSISSKILIHKRPLEICGDEVETNKIIKYDLNLIDNEFYIQTHVTNPLLSKKTIHRAYQEFLKQKGTRSLFSVNSIKARFYDEKAKPLNHDPSILLPTQNLNPIFIENSLFYFFSKTNFMKNEKRIDTQPIMFETPQLESIDIDEYWQFQLTESIIKNQELYESIN